MKNHKGRNKLIAFIIGLSIFLSIAYLLYSQGTLAFDDPVREIIYNNRNDFFNVVFIGITYMANWQFIIALCALACLPKFSRRHFALPMVLSASSSTVLYSITKSFFARPRPDSTLHLIEQGGYSFPSGHSMTGLVFYGMMLWLFYQTASGNLCHESQVPLPLKKKSILTLLFIGLTLLVLLIGFSRIYLGVHYPSDVLGGWSLGIAFLMILITII